MCYLQGMAFPVVLLPGIVLPAELAYAALLAELGDGVDAVAKDLELYAPDDVPADYSLDLDVAGVFREADARGWDRVHLVGYSGGGAIVLMATARHPDRVASLALLEPAWAGRWDLSADESAMLEEYARIGALPPEEFMSAFVRLALAPGVTPPPPAPGDPPAWMASRPAGIAAITRAFATDELDRGALERFPRPVYFALGGLSNPRHYGEVARRLEGVFRDFELEVFVERHHFDPPHRIEPARLARSLKALWARAEG